jgi:hypothetical protein
MTALTVCRSRALKESPVAVRIVDCEAGGFSDVTIRVILPRKGSYCIPRLICCWKSYARIRGKHVVCEMKACR